MTAFNLLQPYYANLLNLLSDHQLSMIYAPLLPTNATADAMKERRATRVNWDIAVIGSLTEVGGLFVIQTATNDVVEWILLLKDEIFDSEMFGCTKPNRCYSPQTTGAVSFTKVLKMKVQDLRNSAHKARLFSYLRSFKIIILSVVSHLLQFVSLSFYITRTVMSTYMLAI